MKVLTSDGSGRSGMLPEKMSVCQSSEIQWLLKVMVLYFKGWCGKAVCERQKDVAVLNTVVSPKLVADRFTSDL